MIDVSIIIVNWNTRDILRECLASIYLQTEGISYEIIVIDNASSDSSAEMVKREFSQVLLLENQENRGFAAANNQGMKIARGRYFLLLNPDTIVLDRAIPKTVTFAEKNPGVAVVGCQVWLNEDEIQQTCFSFPSLAGIIFQEIGLRRLFPKSHLFGKANYGWWDRKSQMDVDVVSGMYMLVRREAIEQIGYMDEDYFVYAEETDWCFRFRKAGWRCIFTPLARIIHLDGGSKSTEQISVKMFVQHQKSLLIFFRKNRRSREWVAVKIIFIGTMLLKLIFFSCIFLIKKTERIIILKKQAHAGLIFNIFNIEYR